MAEFKKQELSNETNIAASRGASVSDAYTNQPIMYGDEILDAAKTRFFFLDAVNVRTLPQGHKDYVEYKRKKYLGSSDLTFDSGEKGGSDITNTTMNNLTGVTITPSFYSARITVENYSARVNVFNLLDRAREELVYGIADKVDQKVATDIGDATMTDSTSAGAQILFGGSGNSGDDDLSDSDTLTPSMIAEAARYLKGKSAYYWDGSTFTKSSDTKNGWQNTTETPFVLFVGAAQEMALRKDSQFTNASEYGNNEVVLNGEIGKYLGIKIVVTNNVESVSSGSTGPDGNSAGADMTRCILCVPQRAYTFVWGMAPEISVHNLAWQASQTIVLQTAYDGSVIHDDAIVFLDVADK